MWNALNYWKKKVGDDILVPLLLTLNVNPVYLSLISKAELSVCLLVIICCYLLLFVSIHTAYTIAKYGMSMCVLGMAEEFKKEGVAVNALWPKTGN